MADKNKFMQMSWFQRASDKNMPTTEANETVRTASFDLPDGTIILVPTIRLVDGKLEEVADPVGEAMRSNDFLTYFHFPLIYLFCHIYAYHLNISYIP